MNIPLLTEFRTLYLVLLIMYVSVCLRVYFVADFLHIECYCIYSLLLSQAVDPPAGITGMLLHTCVWRTTTGCISFQCALLFDFFKWWILCVQEQQRCWYFLCWECEELKKGRRFGASFSARIQIKFSVECKVLCCVLVGRLSLPLMCTVHTEQSTHYLLGNRRKCIQGLTFSTGRLNNNSSSIIGVVIVFRILLLQQMKVFYISGPVCCQMLSK